MGFERLSLKSGKMRCYFIANPQSFFFESAYFKTFIAWVGLNAEKEGLTLKQSRAFLILIKENIYSLSKARVILEGIHHEIDKQVKHESSTTVSEPSDRS